MAVIYITSKDGTRQKFRLPSEPGSIISIGRDASCLVSIPDVVGLSGRHCTIRREGADYVIADNNSTNGTLCDGEPITERVLRRGAVYSLGEATLVFDPELSSAPKIDLAALAAGRDEEAAAHSAERKGPDATDSPSPQGRGEASDGASRSLEVKEEAGELGRDSSDEGSSVESRSSSPPAEETPAPRLHVPAGARRRSRSVQPAVSSTRHSAFVRLFVALYVLAVLGGAFYAGLTLRHWWETGLYLPEDESAAASSDGEPSLPHAVPPAAVPSLPEPTSGSAVSEGAAPQGAAAPEGANKAASQPTATAQGAPAGRISSPSVMPAVGDGGAAPAPASARPQTAQQNADSKVGVPALPR